MFARCVGVSTRSQASAGGHYAGALFWKLARVMFVGHVNRFALVSLSVENRFEHHSGATVLC